MKSPLLLPHPVPAEKIILFQELHLLSSPEYKRMEFLPNESNGDTVVPGFADRLKIYPLQSFSDSEENCRPEICSACGSLGNLKLITWKENGDRDAALGCVLV